MYFLEHPGESAGVIDSGYGMEFPSKAQCEKVRKHENHAVMHIPKVNS